MSADFTPSFGVYKETGSFKFWCQKVLPLVYDDSLSYYETLCKVVKYLNDVIANVDVLHDDVDGLRTAYIQLQNYVNSYFDNLDVQNEINKKLDDMADDGSLSALLSPIVATQIGGVVGEQIDAVVGEQIDASVGRQIDESVASQIATPTATATTAWLTEHVTPVGGAVVVDDSLSIEGAAADAKACGDGLSRLNNALTDNSNGNKQTESFSLAAGASHSSGNDRIMYPVHVGEYLKVSASQSPYSSSNALSILGIKTDGTADNVNLLGATKGEKLLKVTKDYIGFGVYAKNNTDASCDMSFSVEKGNLADLYDNTRCIVQINGNGKILTKSSGDTVVQIENSLIFYFADITVTKNKAAMLDEISGSTAYSTNGVQFTIPYNSTLYYSIADNTLGIKNKQLVSLYGEIPLIITQYGGVCGGLLFDLINKWKADVNCNCKNFIAYVGTDSGATYTINGNNTILVLNSSLTILLNNGTSVGKTQEQIITDLGAAASADGSKTVITLNANKALVYNMFSGSLMIKDRNALAQDDDLVILTTQYGGISGGYLFPKIVETNLKTLSNELFLTDGNVVESVESQCDAFNQLYVDAVDTESFLFFTDIHNVNPLVDDKKMRLGINMIEKAFNATATTYCISGGDWLRADDTKAQALSYLGYIDGYMRKKFGDYYLPVLGNHDTNYQGVEELPITTLQEIWFRKYGNKCYYEYKAINSRFYVFDTGIDSDTSMDTYRWTQCDWFATKLLENDDAHSIMFMHIFTRATKAEIESDVDTYVFIFSQYLFAIAQAYNAKTSVTVNGITYDFSDTTGKIAFAQCGHGHYDSIVTYKNIPVVITTRANTGSSTADKSVFDLCYVDYTHGKYKMIRCGSDGTDREVNIVV